MPASRVLEGLPPPQPGRAVEVEEASSPVPPRLLEEEVAVQEHRLGPGQPGVGLVQVVPAGLDHPHAGVRHRGQQSAEQVRPGQEVGVEDQKELARGSSQPSGQRTCLEALAVGSPQHRHVDASSAPEAGSSLGQGRGLVRGVVEDLDLKAVAGVGQATRRVDQPLHHAALVEDGQLDCHAGRGPAFRCRRDGGCCGHGVGWRHGRRCRRRGRQASPRKQQQKRSVARERQQQSQHDAVGGDDGHGERVRHGRAESPRLGREHVTAENTSRPGTPSRLGREAPAAADGKGRVLGKRGVLLVAQAEPEDGAPSRLHPPRPLATPAEPDLAPLVALAALLGPDSHERQVPPPVAAPVGEVATAVAKRALGAGRHVGRQDADRERVLPDTLAEVQKGGAGGPWQLQGREHLGADLVASTADRRTRMDREARGPAPEGAGQGDDSGLDHASGDASPPGVEERDRPDGRIGQEDGNAVGQGYGEQQAGRASCVTVAVGSQEEAVGNGAVDANRSPVDLPAAQDGAPRPVVVQCLNAFGRNAPSRPLAGEAGTRRRWRQRGSAKPRTLPGLARAGLRSPPSRSRAQPGERLAPTGHRRGPAVRPGRRRG